MPDKGPDNCDQRANPASLMETLLAHSFDYLSSYDQGKIRKGLRQVEGLLAQICLSRSKVTAADKRRSAMPLGANGITLATAKPLSELSGDPAFREFFKLQEGFQWNVAMRLISCLEHLLGRGSNGTNDRLIISTLDLIQGTLLLHPPSRSLFAREIYMNLLLDLLEPANCPAIQSSTLLTLVTALLDNPANTRTFEALDGLLTVTSLFKMRTTSREVKLKLVEFLYFYLMPETPSIPSANSASAPNTAILGLGLHRSPSKLAGAFSRSFHGAGDGGRDARGSDTKTTEEKQVLLGKYLSNVEDLVEDLKESAPFEGTVY
ncbi:cell division control protein [Histoplasma capsulatum H143]|uniref:Cell division control protein n=1 Tax=Ajellomyces capsulatus (strain H143) TaxID=544712 RepID=C6HTH1_AJECH|nr:cell division control protein [Histoplasma capsulatum H143]